MRYSGRSCSDLFSQFLDAGIAHRRRGITIRIVCDRAVGAKRAAAGILVYRCKGIQVYWYQGLTGRVFQLRVGSGSGIGKNYRVGSGSGSGSGIGNIY